MSRPQPASLLVVLAFLMTGLLAACGGDDEVPFTVDEPAQLTCSEECAARGQCGTLPDSSRVVLASTGGPAVTLHDRFFRDGAAVTVVEINERELIAARDNQPLTGIATPFPHTFYRVSGEDRTAWVSEWCMARP